MTKTSQPFRLLPILRPRIWGRHSLAPYHLDVPAGQPVGEMWFTFEENATSLDRPLGDLLRHHPEILGQATLPQYPGVCPLLIKLLFTSSRLSVQVHPEDTYAAEHHESLGKTEAWYVLQSEPPGEVAVGFREPMTLERLRDSAHSGEIERLLDWRKVNTGDVVFVPAGTVHAIGAGLTICEIQQNSDITYRLYDYGRPRELHLDHGCRVSHLGPHLYKPQINTLAPWRDHLVSCPYFHIERLRLDRPVRVAANLPHYLLLVCVGGSGLLAGKPFTLGQTWMLPAGGESVILDGSGSEWILAYTAEEPTGALSEVSPVGP
ncbi:MAG TPA: type I phosphomannose isomerase catalytic subunit [Bryobacteraceae bacterium]|nr:type I phosphomannose isomerase catalytic subunit [Bryobacteraceae bacterium]